MVIVHGATVILSADCHPERSEGSRTKSMLGPDPSLRSG